MSDEFKFILQLALNLAAIVIAVWLATNYSTRQLHKLLKAERQAAEEASRRMQAEVLANLPAIPPELEQIVETERWLLTARDLQLLLTSLGTLVRIRLRADAATQQGILSEIDRSLKFLERQEKRWLNPSLQIIAYARQLDPAQRQPYNHALEHWISYLTQTYVQAAQSLRRAASLSESDGLEVFSAAMINTYLTEAEQSSTDMISGVASALDRLTYVKQNLPNYQAQQIVDTLSQHLL
jgi:hypothetical protein